MSLLLDTGVLHAFLNRRDRHHEEAMEIVAAAQDGAHGAVWITTFILDEAIKLVRVRRQPYQTAESLLGMTGLLPDSDLPQLLRLRTIDLDDVTAAIPLQRRHWERGLSFTDCTSLHVMDADRIDRFATFDSGFDGLVPIL